MRKVCVMQRVRMLLVLMSAALVMSPPFAWSQVDASTHESVRAQDERVDVLETVHVNGLKLNRDQQLGPVPTYTPWPTMPRELQRQKIDDSMKARILVSKTGETTLVVLVPAKNRRINLAGIHALKQWKFDPQMKGDEFVDGEVTISIDFRTHEP